MLADMSVNEFLSKVASSEPTPGGGSIAALCGAVACSLSTMVAALTVGNKKYAGVREEMKELIFSMEGLVDFFIVQMDDDAQAFESVMEAYRMPKNSDEEKKLRSATIQQRLKGATEVPLDVAQKALKAMDMIEKAVEKGNSQAVTDGAVAVMMARTAVLSALYNVKINLAYLKDDEYIQNMQHMVRSISDIAADREKQILEKVKL